MKVFVVALFLIASVLRAERTFKRAKFSDIDI
jgi:hypothetical protein